MRYQTQQTSAMHTVPNMRLVSEIYSTRRGYFCSRSFHAEYQTSSIANVSESENMGIRVVNAIRLRPIITVVASRDCGLTVIMRHDLDDRAALGSNTATVILIVL